MATERPRLTLLLVGIVLLALAIRFFGISFGLPSLHNPDEPVFVEPAQRILETGDLNPRTFAHPGGPTIYLLSMTYGVIYLVGAAIEVFHTPADFHTLYYQDPTLFYLSGRIENAIFGAAIVLVTYLIGKRLFNYQIGIVAALIVAVAPAHVEISRLVRTDIQMGLLVLLGFWHCMGIMETGKGKHYLLAGLFTGIGIAAKYPAAVLGLTILVAHFSRKPFRLTAWRNLILCGGAALVGMFVTAPFLFLDAQAAFQEFLYQNRGTHLGATGEGFFLNLLWYIRQAFIPNFTHWGTAIMGVGLAACLLSKDRYLRLLVVFPVTFLLVISTLNLRWTRWIIPVMPYFALMLAYAIVNLPLAWQNRFSPRWINGGRILVIASVLTPLTGISALRGIALSSKDTRMVAGEWMLANLPADSRVMVEMYTPQLPDTYYEYYEVRGGVLTRFDPEALPQTTIRPVGMVGDLLDYHAIEQNQIRYVVLANWYERFLAERERYPRALVPYEWIQQNGRLLFEIMPTPRLQSGLPVRIYELNPVVQNCSAFDYNLTALRQEEDEAWRRCR
jgi:4-amino-4-deoxy-L-arabinose transferase-like glycosyltransferase